MQSFLVQPGYTVDSNTTMSFFLIKVPTSLQAFFKRAMFGLFFESIGVGTAMMYILHPLILLLSSVNNIFLFKIFLFIYAFSSILSLREFTLLELKSKPITLNFLLNSRANGRPT